MDELCLNELVRRGRGRPTQFSADQLKEHKKQINKRYYEENKMKNQLNKLECEICHKFIVSSSLKKHISRHTPTEMTQKE